MCQTSNPLSPSSPCRPQHFNTMASFRTKDKRQSKFIFYINCILDYLRISAPPTVEVQIKMVISECIKRNRVGDSSHRPLRTSIVLHLQRCMGPTHWALANLHYKKMYEEFTILGNLKKMAKLESLPTVLPTTIPSQCSNSNFPPPSRRQLVPATQFAMI